MENQNEKVNDVNGENNDGQEPVTVITTKDALKAIGRNAKVKAKETWLKAKPVLKKAAVVTAVVVGASYAIDKINKPALEQANDWHDDDVVDSEATVVDVGDGTITFEPKKDEPAAETTEE